MAKASTTTPAAQGTVKPSTGIHVIVVGTGFGGLTAAIECKRQGHDVVVLEKYTERKELGDIISFGHNASRIFGRWPGVADQLGPLSHHADSLQLRTYRGEPLVRQYWDGETRAWGVRYDGHRGEFHSVLYLYAVEDLGIDIRLGHRVVEYFETAEGAGVEVEVIADNNRRQRFEADVILAADGVRSTGRTLVLGREDRPKPSGYAVYRAWFDGSAIANDPVTSFLYNRPEGDQHICWIGPDVHFIASSLTDKGSFSWVCTHRDEADIDESWQLEAPVADARRVLQGWDPIVQRILDLTPEPLVDWKLVYRDPLPTWISPHRRIALLGDAAHPFLPTSIQGASQAVEDGVTVAVALRRAAEDVASSKIQAPQAVPEAVAAFEALRYERVCAAQKTGERTRDTWHRADFSRIHENPESMKLRREAWILGHDAEAYAESNYAATVALLRQTGLADTAAARQWNRPPVGPDLCGSEATTSGAHS